MIVLISLIMTSCVEEFEIEDKDFESRLVINALFDNNSPWAVKISNTANIFNSTTVNEKITFAKVEIYDQNNEFLYELYHQEDGIYGRDDYGPSPKRGYSVKVSAPGYHAVTAKSFVPEKSTLLINNFSIIPNDKKNDVEVDFEIEDKSMLESYYIWEVVSISGDNDGNDENSSSMFSEKWIDDLTNPGQLGNSSRVFLENGSFGDGTYKGTYSSIDGNRRINIVNNINNDGLISLLNLTPNENTIKTNPLLDNDLDEVVTHLDELDEDDPNVDGNEPVEVIYNFELRVMTISKELYNYYSSLEEHYQNGQSSHSNEAPFKLYTNVTNGVGIFAGFSESVIQF